MRLSIANVFLIGAMVASEAMCDTVTDVAIVRVWFDQTVKRLETGQTLTENREFVDLTIDRADELLEYISCQKFVNYRSAGNHNPDRVLIDRITAIQEEHLTSNADATVHVKHLLEAIKQVLHGNLVFARAAIDKSETDLSYNLTLDDELTMNTVARTLGHKATTPGEQDIAVITVEHLIQKPTYYILGRVQQTAEILEWLKLRLSRLGNQDWIERFLACVPEIAQALVNVLPEAYIPEGGSRFIGRYPLEEPGVIANRIPTIERRTTNLEEGSDMPLAVVLTKSVLQAISLILRKSLLKPNL
jgi:hypothetical protein